jgi:hypothetical protein
MSDQELAVQAISEAQHILEEYLEPRRHNNEMLLDRLVEVLERPSVLVAVFVYAAASDKGRRPIGSARL